MPANPPPVVLIVSLQSFWIRGQVTTMSDSYTKEELQGALDNYDIWRTEHPDE